MNYLQTIRLRWSLLLTVFVFAFITLFPTSKARASHIISYEISYDHVVADSYRLRIEFIRWCGGTLFFGGNPPIPSQLSLSAYCPSTAQTQMFTVYLQQVQPLQLFCSDSSALNSCGASGSAGLIGYSVCTYESVVQMNSSLIACGGLQLLLFSSARTYTTNVMSQPGYVALSEPQLNVFPENSSPRSFRFDIPGNFVENTPYDMSLAMYDVDGDSLRYSFDTAYSSWSSFGFTPVAYQTGYSALSPAPGMSLDGATGQLTWTPTIPSGYSYAQYIICMRIDEYEPGSGAFKGSTYRDVQFQVLPDAGENNPVFQSITNVSGASLVDTSSLHACAGDTFCFDITFADADLGDSIYVTSSLQDVASYYSISVAGANPATATICAVIDRAYDYGIDVLVKGMDNHCSIVGQTNQRIHITTTGPTNQSVFACFDAADTVQTSSDFQSIWSVVSGDTLSAQNFSCLNTGCTEVVLSPLNTTTYQVLNLMSMGCELVEWIDVMTAPTVLHGTVTDASSNAVTATKVYLVDYQVSAGVVQAIDSTITDGSGAYAFTLTSPDSFLVKVSPDSAAYPLLMPTYVQQQITVQAAAFITPDYCDTLVLNPVMVAGQNPGGPGFIGGFVAQGAGREEGEPVAGVSIILMDGALAPIAQRYTNANGYFRFNGLNTGSYSVFVDHHGIDNGQAPVLDLTDSISAIDSLQFILQPTVLELVRPDTSTSVRDVSTLSAGLTVVPNPTDGLLKLVLSDASDRITDVRITDVSGAVVYVAQGDRRELQLSDLPSGIYIVEVGRASGVVSRVSMVKQ